LVYECLHFPGNQQSFSGILVRFGKTALENQEFELDSGCTLGGFPQQFVQTPQASLESLVKFHRLVGRKIPNHITDVV
jgi:hypothetical protein